MSDLPGNPHYQAIEGQELPTDNVRTWAQLAIAHELRTQNLIAYLDWLTKHELSGGEAIYNEIRDRLGLED